MSEPHHLVCRSSMVVRWGDLDAFGHVNNVHYFRFMEQCRVEWLERLQLFPSRRGVDLTGEAPGATGGEMTVDNAGAGHAAREGGLPDPHIQVVVASLSCNFKVPIHYPATLSVSLYTGRVGRSSLATWHEIHSGDGAILYADGAATLVWIDTRSGRSVPLPERVRAAATASSG